VLIVTLVMHSCQDAVCIEMISDHILGYCVCVCVLAMSLSESHAVLRLTAQLIQLWCTVRKINNTEWATKNRPLYYSV